MKSGLGLLSDLTDEDIAWLIEHGEDRQVISNQVVVEEGKPAGGLVFVLEGLLGVRVSSLPGKQLATLGPGELIGEISFLDQTDATATVFAVENSLVLTLPEHVLRQEVEANPIFAARLYRAFAVTATRRLIERERHYGRLLAQVDQARDGHAKAWDRLAPMLEAFKRGLQDADKIAIKEGGVPPAEIEQKILDGFSTFTTFLNEQLGDACGLHPNVREELGARVQAEVLPYLLLTRTAERLYAKPRGYAGDFLSIDWIYGNEASGSGRLGPILDRAFLDEPAARAVRNRRGLLAQRIANHIERVPDRPVRITAMACGPAREVFDVFETLDDPGRLEVTLIDIDQEALEQVSEEVARRDLGAHVRTFHANLIYLAMGRQKIDLESQDLMYSIGLIDYFNDKLVKKLVDYGHRCLALDGELILGNFHPNNTDKALMDHVLDWRLIHRSEEDMNTLFEGSDFARPCTSTQFEDAGVNLFAACTRQTE